jgi:ABC-type Zn2+ transport system substrate-binding protein/surface adhesin
LAAVNGVKKVTFDVQAYSNVWFYANPIFIRPEDSSKLLVEKNADLARRLAERADNDHDGHGHDHDHDHDHDRHDHDGRDHDGRDHDRD